MKLFSVSSERLEGKMSALRLGKRMKYCQLEAIVVVFAILLSVGGCSGSAESSAGKVCFEISGELPEKHMIDERGCLVSTDVISFYVWLSAEGEPTNIDELRILSFPGWHQNRQSWRQQQQLESEPEYVLELRGSSGKIVHSTSLRFYETTPGSSRPGASSPTWQRQGTLERFVPNPPVYSSLAVRFRGREIAEFQRSPNVPSVAIIKPEGSEVYDYDEAVNVVWTTSDHDEDQLTATLYYSIDGGATYTRKPLNNNESIQASELSLSNQVRIRVYVSDGTRTAFAETQDFKITL